MYRCGHTLLDTAWIHQNVAEALHFLASGICRCAFTLLLIRNVRHRVRQSVLIKCGISQRFVILQLRFERICIYIYIYRDTYIYLLMCMYVCIYIYFFAVHHAASKISYGVGSEEPDSECRSS